MTKRKSRTVKQEADQILERLKEVQELQQLAEQEEKEILEATQEQIKTLCEDNNLFCGIIITTDDLLTIVKTKLSIDPKDSIRIPFRLYYNDL